MKALRYSSVEVLRRQDLSGLSAAEWAEAASETLGSRDAYRQARAEARVGRDKGQERVAVEGEEEPPFD